MGEAKRRRAAADPVALRVSELAVAAVTELATRWPEHGGYDNLRGAVIYAAFEVLAERACLFAVPIELVEPTIPPAAALRLRILLCEGLAEYDVTPEHFGCVHETLTGYGITDGVVARTDGRRKGGVHFTPRSLTAKVVGRTLEPLLACMANQRGLAEPTAEQVLSLRVCDPSVGAGAFLLELVRQLAPRVLAGGLARDLDEAKRLVAIHCARGVDRCPFAVYATKLALRLECRADHMPVDWLDDNVRVGDALVGLDREQFVSFDWKRGKPEIPFLAEMWDEAAAAAALRAGRAERLSQLARRAG